MANLLTQNAELRPLGIHNWTLPAWVIRTADGRNINVCPSAGACVKLCYARTGKYQFSNVKPAHERHLLHVIDDLPGWIVDMLNELDKPRFKPTGQPRLPDLPRNHLHPHTAKLLDNGAPCIRIHDSGDFFSDDYLAAWLHIAHLRPDVLFYAYTKEVTRTRRVINETPPNFLICYSLGGREDHLLNLDEGGDRHADVFPNEHAIEQAGYYNQEPHDLLCVVAPSTRIGIPANNITQFRRAQGDNTFGQLEAATRRTR